MYEMATEIRKPGLACAVCVRVCMCVLVSIARATTYNNRLTNQNTSAVSGKKKKT